MRGSRRCVRIFQIGPGSVMNAISRMSPPAMGYTFNWNSLQDGSDPSYGTDPLAPAGSFGLAEFIVSAGSKIVNERFVTNANLGVWVVPEPALMGPGILAVFVVLLLRRSDRRVRQPPT
jgi:hypothetical protein